MSPSFPDAININVLIAPHFSSPGQDNGKRHAGMARKAQGFTKGFEGLENPVKTINRKEEASSEG